MRGGEGDSRSRIVRRLIPDIFLLVVALNYLKFALIKLIPVNIKTSQKICNKKFCKHFILKTNTNLLQESVFLMR